MKQFCSETLTIAGLRYFQRRENLSEDELTIKQYKPHEKVTRESQLIQNGKLALQEPEIIGKVKKEC